MQVVAQPTATQSKVATWVGYMLSALGVLFMVFDGGGKIAQIQPVVDAFALLDMPISTAVGIGVLSLVIVVVYLVPRTALLGAILMTGYLGGAMAVQVRSGAPVFSIVFPLIIAAFFWGGLYLRDPKVRDVLPFRS